MKNCAKILYRLLGLITLVVCVNARVAGAESAQDDFAQLTQLNQEEVKANTQIDEIKIEKKKIDKKFADLNRAIEKNNRDNTVIESEVQKFNASNSAAGNPALEQRREANMRKGAELNALQEDLKAKDKARMAKAVEVVRHYKEIKAQQKAILASLSQLKVFHGNVQDCLKLSPMEAVVQCMQSHWDGANANPGSDDTSVVDARNVPTGLPKSVEKEIPHSPAGDRVRKGFEAIQDHDWKVALAWFQDAQNKEPGNMEITRLVDLAQYTLQRKNPKNSSHSNEGDTTKKLKELDGILDKKQNEDLSKSLSDFYQNYLPKHPVLMDPPSPKETNWGAFGDALFKPAKAER